MHWQAGLTRAQERPLKEDDLSKENLKRIGLVGPVLPFRGGIAQHTTMLHRSLTRRSELLTVSFKRQYLKWLYPGRGTSEPGYEGHREDGVLYLLDPLNPATWLKACGLLAKHRPDAVAVAWWTVFWAPCFLFMASWLRRKGIRVIFICHNVFDHEPAFWKPLLARAVLSQGSAFVVQSNAEAQRLTVLLGIQRVKVHTSPAFNQFPPPARKLPRRTALELLFFGLVRSYKGLDVLIEAMEILKDDDVFLTVAGEWWVRDKRLRRRAEEVAKVEVIDRYIPEGETGEYFERADAVVLPYRSATATAVIPLAYHYGKPVIASRIGGLEDAVDDGVSGLLFKSGDAHSLASAIRKMLQNKKRLREGASGRVSQATWDSLAECTLGLALEEGQT